MKKRQLKGQQRKMDSKISDEFKESLQEALDNELDNRETFSDEMVQHINDVYRQLWKEKIEWLKKKKEEQS